MPGCAAVGCSNSAKKGFIMKKFPKDPARRKEWLNVVHVELNISRSNYLFFWLCNYVL
jgi:hypothetical protein